MDKKQFLSIYLISEQFLQPNIVKNAGVSDVLSGFYDKIKSEVSSEPGTILKYLSEGALTALGYGKLAILFEVGTRLFGIDFNKLFSDLRNKVSSLISGDKKTNENEVKSIVEQVVSSNEGGISPEITEQIQKSSSLKEAYYINKIVKNAGAGDKAKEIITRLFGIRSLFLKALIGVLIFVVSTLLFAGGFFVAGTVLDNLFGKKDTSHQSTQQSQLTQQESKQSYFKLNPSYTNTILNSKTKDWVVPISANNIADTILLWSHQVYSDMDLFDNDIRQLNTFNKMIQYIKDYNSNSDNVTYMPQSFATKKQVIDQFIDELVLKVVKENKTKQ